jgi:hypothetical protein
LEAVLEGKVVAPRTMRDFLYDATAETSLPASEVRDKFSNLRLMQAFRTAIPQWRREGAEFRTEVMAWVA